jgi:hypothetical protein
LPYTYVINGSYGPETYQSQIRIFAIKRFDPIIDPPRGYDHWAIHFSQVGSGTGFGGNPLMHIVETNINRDAWADISLVVSTTGLTTLTVGGVAYTNNFALPMAISEITLLLNKMDIFEWVLQGNPVPPQPPRTLGSMFVDSLEFGALAGVPL